MQISVVKPDESNIQKLQEIISYVYRAYGVQSVEAYIVKDDGELGFVFYGDEMNMYVNNKKDGLEFTAFQLDEDERLTYVGNTEYRIFFEPNGSMQVVDAEGREMYIFVNKLIEGLEADFNSYLCFRQYSQEHDTAVELQYAQNLCLDKKDTSVYVKEVENVFIDPRWTTRGGNKPGIVTGGKKYFCRVDCRAIDIVDGSTEEHSAYLPIRYISNSGGYYTMGHLATKYNYDEIAEMIKNIGLLPQIPHKLVEIYREVEPGFRKLQWIVRETCDIRNQAENDKGIVLQIKLDEIDKN